MKLLLMIFINSMVISHIAWSVQFDPMAPPGYGAVIEEKKIVRKTVRKYHYNLRQVVISDKGSRAVINGYVLKEGEYINKARVVKIEENKVTLSKSGKLSVIKLNRPISNVRR